MNETLVPAASVALGEYLVADTAGLLTPALLIYAEAAVPVTAPHLPDDQQLRRGGDRVGRASGVPGGRDGARHEPGAL